jgi:hypothetical protein
VAKRLARRFALEKCRVQNPGPPTCVFSEVFPHNHILRAQRMLNTYLPSSFRTHPHQAVPIPNLPVIVAEKALESLSSPALLRGGMKNCTFSVKKM